MLKAHRKDRFLGMVSQRISDFPKYDYSLLNPKLWNPGGWVLLARIERWAPRDVRKNGVVIGVGEFFSRRTQEIYGERKRHLQRSLTLQFVNLVHLVHLVGERGEAEAIELLEPSVLEATAVLNLLNDSLVEELVNQEAVERERRRRRGMAAGLPARLFSNHREKK